MGDPAGDGIEIGTRSVPGSVPTTVKVGGSRVAIDVSLVRQAQGGDHAAFTAIVDASADRLFVIASLISRDRTISEDAVQDALVRAWRDLPRLRDPERIVAWLSRLTVNATYDLLRRRRRQGDVRPLKDTETMAGDEVSRTVDRSELAWAFGRLPAEQRAVIVLHYYVGLSLDEAASTLEIPPGTVRSRLHAGLVAMRASIAPGLGRAARSATKKVSP